MNELDPALEALAAGRVTVGSRPIAEVDVSAMLGEECDAMSRVSPKRRREFATGRVLLRSLLGEPVVVPNAPNPPAHGPAGGAARWDRTQRGGRS